MIKSFNHAPVFQKTHKSLAIKEAESFSLIFILVAIVVAKEPQALYISWKVPTAKNYVNEITYLRKPF